jgi:hypothetical protein
MLKNTLLELLQGERRPSTCRGLARAALLGAVMVGMAWAHADPAQAQRTERVKTRPVSSVFKTITARSVRFDIVSTGKFGDRAVKNHTIKFDVRHDTKRDAAALTVTGPDLGAYFGGDELSSESDIRSFSMFRVDGRGYMALVGATVLCERNDDSADGMDSIVDDLAPDSLFDDEAYQTEGFEGVFVKNERVNGIQTRRYDVVLTPQQRADGEKKRTVWVARDGYVVKLQADLSAEKPSQSLTNTFVGDFRVTYSVVSINKPVDIALPSACNRAATN